MDEIKAGLIEPAEPHLTLDGSLVTELVRPERGGPGNVSVAEAVIEAGGRTLPHRHEQSDEVYYVLSGKGVVALAGNSLPVEPGSCVLIPAGQVHSVRSTGNEVLKILCICSPPYTHEQTVPVD